MMLWGRQRWGKGSCGEKTKVLCEMPQGTSPGRATGPPATASARCRGLPAGSADANGGRTPAVCNGHPRWPPPWQKERPPVAAAYGATPRTRPCHIVGGRRQRRPGGVPAAAALPAVYVASRRARAATD